MSINFSQITDYRSIQLFINSSGMFRHKVHKTDDYIIDSCLLTVFKSRLKTVLTRLAVPPKSSDLMVLYKCIYYYCY